MRRSPHGECGLKYDYGQKKFAVRWSLPAWGVWIEIPSLLFKYAIDVVAPRMGSVD